MQMKKYVKMYRTHGRKMKPDHAKDWKTETNIGPVVLCCLPFAWAHTTAPCTPVVQCILA